MVYELYEEFGADRDSAGTIALLRVSSSQEISQRSLCAYYSLSACTVPMAMAKREAPPTIIVGMELGVIRRSVYYQGALQAPVRKFRFRIGHDQASSFRI